MNIILVPGFWLGAWAWDEVEPVLQARGLHTVSLTLPGLQPNDTNRASVGLADHIAAVVEAIDSMEGPVVLVGHSAGGPICHAAAAQRLARVARVVHVDTWPAADGRCINDELPQSNGVVPLPGWDVFDEPDLIDLNDDLRAMFRARAVDQPARVATERFMLNEPARLDLPTTVIACEFTAAQLRGWMDAGEAALSELASLRNVAWVELPTGHWPMFTRPADLAGVLCDVVATTQS